MAVHAVRLLCHVRRLSSISPRYGPFATYDEFLAFLEGRRLDPGTLLFVVFNTVSDIEDDPVGIAALLNSDKANLVTELGHFRFLPKVQVGHRSSAWP